MSRLPFRFLHAADLHLEVPLHGFVGLPDHLHAMMVDASFRAAERVFDAALSEEVDFVVLAGDVVQAETASVRALVFLCEQFRRLEKRGIPVYWAGGRVDSKSDWPEAFALPDNVHRFGTHDVEGWTVCRDEDAIARVEGISRRKSRKLPTAKFQKSSAGMFTVGVGHANVEGDRLDASTVDYWALGGDHRHRDITTDGIAAHYCGSPQGRNRHETGAHGCLVIDVGLDQKPRARFVATDAVRWHEERLLLTDADTASTLESTIEERVRGMRDPSGAVCHLVHWTLAGTGRLLAETSKGDRIAAVLESTRRRFGMESPYVWTCAIEVEPPEKALETHIERDSILGDLLRAIHEHQVDATMRLDLDRFVRDGHAGSVPGAMFDPEDPSIRRRVLRDAAAVGVEMLDAEEAGR